MAKQVHGWNVGKWFSIDIYIHRTTALNPLSTLLEDSGLGYRMQKDDRVIYHLFYMDDLQLFAPTK